MGQLWRGRRRWVLVGAALGLLLALAGGATLLRTARAQSGLAEARLRWEANGLAAYSLRLTQQTRLSICQQEMTTQDGRATPVSNSCGQPANWTVPRLFNWIAELEREATRCYPGPAFCACQGTMSTVVRYDEASGYPREIIYEWRKRPNLANMAYYRSLLDRSFPGCDKDGRGGPVVVNVALLPNP